MKRILLIACLYAGTLYSMDDLTQSMKEEIAKRLEESSKNITGGIYYDCTTTLFYLRTTRMLSRKFLAPAQQDQKQLEILEQTLVNHCCGQPSVSLSRFYHVASFAHNHAAWHESDKKAVDLVFQRCATPQASSQKFCKQYLPQAHVALAQAQAAQELCEDAAVAQVFWK